jgi:hypothetical protein
VRFVLSWLLTVLPPVSVVDLPGQNNIVNAQVIAGVVDSVRARTGAARVNLVGACFHEIAGVEHPDEPRSAPFIVAAPAAVGGTCPGTFVDLPVT